MDAKNLRDKLVGSDDERAVSPVIGVILMIAITVILAAVIATLVMDIGGNQQEPISAGAEVTEDGETVEVTVANMGNADGVILTDESGNVVANGSGHSSAQNALTTTGVSKTYDLSVNGSPSSYIVYAYQGDTTTGFTAGSSLEDQVERVVVVSDGT